MHRPSPHSSETRVSDDVKNKHRIRAHREQMHMRLICVVAAFFLLFFIIFIKLIYATVLCPMKPEKNFLAHQVLEIPKITPTTTMASNLSLLQTHRASIVDRNGQILALSVPVTQVYANPQELINPVDIAYQLKSVLPQLNVTQTIRRLSEHKKFVYIARNISQKQELAINNLGIPGIYFKPGEHRLYPMDRTAAQVIGAVDIDGHGIAGIEKYFDKQLQSDHIPLRLSIDIRVQSAVREELAREMETSHAIGACSIVMDVHTGEIIAMVSLPDYDANQFFNATNSERFNRAISGVYEPGSVLKLQTAAMGLETGTVHIWDRFSSAPIHIGRFTIQDMKQDHFAPWLTLPEVIAFSSNPGAAHIALDVGSREQIQWLHSMGFFSRPPIELPGSARPLIPHHWGLTTTMVVGFGHGIAVSPLSIVRGTAATINGGILVTPTLIDRTSPALQKIPSNLQSDSQSVPSNVSSVTHLSSTLPKEIMLHTTLTTGQRVLSENVSNLLRRILRLDVTHGTGKKAEVPGYFVGGKTGTAEKVNQKIYLKKDDIASFVAVFPMNAPRYVVYVMFDDPTSTTQAPTTGGLIAAPTVSKIIARIGPLLQVFPDIEDATRIDAQLALSLHPTVPHGVRPHGPGNDPGDPLAHPHQKNPLHPILTTVSTTSLTKFYKNPKLRKKYR